MNRRLQLLLHWLAGRRNGVSLPEIISVVFGRTCIPKAKSKIKSLEETENEIIVFFHDSAYPLYYPKKFPTWRLYQVIAETLYPNNWHYFEIDQTKVTKGDVVVDCGAAEGLFSLLAVPRCNQIYAIEPVPEFIQSMNRTFAPFDNIEIIPVALSNEEGKSTITSSGISSRLTKTGEGRPVKVTTLDSLLMAKEQPIDYLKADLEGHEMLMLKGAENLIKKYKPKIAITTYHGGQSATAIADYLKELNPDYQIKFKGIENRAGAPVMLHAWTQ